MASIEVRVAGKFKVSSLIARGSFCDIYSGRDVHSDIECVIKAESTKSSCPTLQREQIILSNLQGHISIPMLYHFEKTKDFLFLIQDQLGLSIEEYFNRCGRRFSLKTVLMLADQLITLFEYIHSKNVIYRDLSTQNLLMGLGKKNHLLFLVDYGLSIFEHEKQDNSLVGTFKFMSPSVLKDGKHSFKSDMESLGIVLAYLLEGQLPWERQKGENLSIKLENINKRKLMTPLTSLCEQNLPELSNYFRLLNSLGTECKPDYYELKRVFIDRFIQENLHFDYVYDWFLIPIRFNELTPGCNFPLLTHFEEGSERSKKSSMHNHIGKQKLDLPKAKEKERAQSQFKSKDIKKGGMERNMSLKVKEKNSVCMIF